MKAALVLIAGCALSAWALAQEREQEPEDHPARYVLGVSMAVKPEYDGARTYETRFRPLWAMQLGRWRLSTSGGSALLGFGREGAGPGASRQLLERGPWRLGVALRFDNGRSSGDASTTRGLPDVRRTLRARFSASYSLSPDLSLTGAVSQDLLGRRGGLTGGLDLGWRFYRSPTLEWSAGAGISGANALNMRSYFGVPASVADSVGKPAYEPGAGLREMHAGVGFTRPLGKHWFVFGSAGVTRLLGPAADSPLTERRDGASAALGLAWRNL